MSVITISREFGSGGDTVAHKVADVLGYHVVDQKFIGIILGQYGYVEFDREYLTLPTFWERFDAQRVKQRDVMVTMLNQVIQAVARHGNVVILGRSGFQVLGSFADVLHVRLQSPFPVRVRRVKRQENITLGEAETLVKNHDTARVGFVEEFYRVPWSSIEAFDLVVNTGKLPLEVATAWIIEAANTFEIRPELGKPLLASIVVDRILADTVSEVLHCQKVHEE